MLSTGIQQYLYENGRIDSIFADPYFEMFTDRLNDILKGLQPKINKHGKVYVKCLNLKKNVAYHVCNINLF